MEGLHIPHPKRTTKTAQNKEDPSAEIDKLLQAKYKIINWKHICKEQPTDKIYSNIFIDKSHSNPIETETRDKKETQDKKHQQTISEIPNNSIRSNVEEFEKIFSQIEGSVRINCPISLFMAPLLEVRKRKILSKACTIMEGNNNQKEKKAHERSRLLSQYIETIPRSVFRKRHPCRRIIMHRAPYGQGIEKSYLVRKRDNMSIRSILDSISDKVLTKPDPIQIEKHTTQKNKPIAILLSGLSEVSPIKKEYLEKAPLKLRTRIFREGISKQRNRIA